MHDQLQRQRNLDAQIKDLYSQFLGVNKYLTEKNHVLYQDKISFEGVNNQEKCLRGHEDVSFMVFPNKMLTSHIVFKVPLDLIDDQYYPCYIKITNFCFTFLIVFSKPTIFD